MTAAAPPYVDPLEDDPLARDVRAAYLAAGARMNRPEVLAAEAAWLAARRRGDLDWSDADGVHGPQAVEALRDVTSLRYRLRQWLHRTGPRPVAQRIDVDRAWLAGVVDGVAAAVGRGGGPDCACDDCDCGQGCALRGCECESCSYECSGTRCEDDYCSGCPLCAPEHAAPPESLEPFADQVVATVQRLVDTQLAELAAVTEVVGADDHLTLAPLPGTDAPQVRLAGGSVTMNSRFLRARPIVGALWEGFDRVRMAYAATNARGRGVAANGQVAELRTEPGQVTAAVRSSSGGGYAVRLTFDAKRLPKNPDRITPACTCPAAATTSRPSQPARYAWCKHAIGVAYLIADRLEDSPRAVR